MLRLCLSASASVFVILVFRLLVLVVLGAQIAHCCRHDGLGLMKLKAVVAVDLLHFYVVRGATVELSTDTPGQVYRCSRILDGRDPGNRQVIDKCLLV